MLLIKPGISKNGKIEELINIERISNEGTRNLYENRVAQNLNTHDLEITIVSEEC